MNEIEQATYDRAMALDQSTYDNAAFMAAEQLRCEGSAWVALSPGDGTRYVFTIVQFPEGYVGDTADEDGNTMRKIRRKPGHYIVASSLAPAYEWHGGEVHFDYAMEKWSPRPNVWTAVAAARFLNALSERLKESVDG